ncbi:MAG: tetratricopeptide repeat protein [Pirellulales bacterium]
MNETSSTSAPLMAPAAGGPNPAPLLEPSVDRHEPGWRHPAGRPRRRPSRRLLALLAAVLVSTGGGSWLFYRHNQPDARFRRGLEAIKARDFERVKYCLVGLPEAPRYEPHVALLNGSLLLERKQFKEALRELHFSLDHDQTRPTALTLAGMALHQLGYFQLAERNLQFALQQDPEQVDAHRWLAAAYYDVGVMDRAMVHLEKVAEMDLSDPRPHRIMGLIRMDKNSDAQAVEDYQESLRRDPKQPDAQQIRLELAETQMDLLQYPQALKTLADSEQTADVLGLAAECHYNEGRKRQAIEIAERALELVPHHRPALLFKARLAADSGDQKRQRQILEQLVKHYPNSFDSHYNLALAYQRMGLVDKADEQMKEVQRLQDLRRENDELLQQAEVELYNADIRYRLGVISDQLDMKKLAKTWYRAALALDPGHFKARVALNN